MLIFCIYSLLIDFVHYYFQWEPIDITPFEVFGAILGVLIVFKTNAGYDRWWEGRKIWGGIVNQSRNLVATGLQYGPKDATWRDDLARWASAFPYSCKASLRGISEIEDMKGEFSDSEYQDIVNSQHMPLYISSQIGKLAPKARDDFQMDGFTFIEMEKHRALLIDYIGACERVLETPIPLVYAIKVRRLILIFLLTVPVAIAPKAYWLAPVIMFFISYPLLSLDVIGMELQNPFSLRNLSHLPLQDICDTIRKNIKGLRVKSSD